ncbi:unnamed protein product [Ixodes hexagonus]
MICSKHFATEKPSKDPNHPDWVPHIFAHRRPTSHDTLPAVQRYQRAVYRRRAPPSHNQAMASQHQLWKALAWRMRLTKRLVLPSVK